jgi:two-component system NtrC family sensor kinase
MNLVGKKYYALVFSLLCVLIESASQEQRIADSLFQIYSSTSADLPDSARSELLLNLSFNENADVNKALKYAEELISLSQQTGYAKYLRSGYFLKGTKERLLGNLDEALKAFLKSAELAKKSNNLTAEADSYSAIADVYSSANNSATAKQYYSQAIELLRRTKDSVNLASTLLNAGDEFRKDKNYDTALLYFNESKIIFNKKNYLSGKGYSLGNIGMVYASIGANDLAEKNINEALQILQETQDYYPMCDYLISMADVYASKGDIETALKYASKSLQLAEENNLVQQVADADLKISSLYEKLGDNAQSLKYYKNYIIYRDSLNNITSVQRMADLRTAYEVSRKQSEVNLLSEQKRNQRSLLISLGVILAMAIIILMVMIRSNNHKQKAYEVLNKQKQETDMHRSKAEAALNELQLTQKQLIHTEKMASLGELTAGIAHEIQNPLNFVNNFSDVNKELLLELKDETDKGNMDEIRSIANDLLYNEEKINHHGKRADAIVKGMLQHSRASSGQRESTDINVLADEYLRLAYHGFRAKDRSFNAKFKTDFDPLLGRINVVPQEIGRVLLNLITNAFYTVNEKSKQDIPGYDPTVTVATKKHSNGTEIRVVDNGKGIPQNIVDKIFQPFFTTKPTGQGTGLGLSLAYDIVQAHGGDKGG